MQGSSACVRLGTKAETLERLRPAVRSATVLPLQYVDLKTWRARREHFLDRVCAESWGASTLIVRSSARKEDVPGSSQAGRYLSVAHVAGRAQLAEAIDAVFASYDPPGGSDQVLVQPQLLDTRLTGVASSVDPSSGAPYQIINWSEGSDTAAVTSGRSGGLRTWYGVSGAPSAAPPNQDIAAVVALIRELEQLTGVRELDIEFGVCSCGALVLFQARPLTAPPMSIGPADHAQALETIAARIAGAQREQPGVLGGQTVFGVMPDWNPAEMIGRRPRPLALSLYKRLITERVWALARRTYGYRDVGPTPLMTDYYGLPYIDVRASFSSLIPAGLEESIARRLVEHYIQRLRANPAFHDKVEFEIILSCYSPSLPRRLGELASAGFSASDRQAIADALRGLTDRMIRPEGPWAADLERFRRLRDVSARAESDQPPGSPGRVAALLDACERYGTLPFAGLARAGFVAVEFLNGLVEAGVISAEQKSAFMAELGNITSVLIDEFHALSKALFLARYGHLRPGTYDILSPRYDEQPERYFDWSGRDAGRPRTAEHSRFELTPDQEGQIERLLGTLGLHGTCEQLLHFMGCAIRGREEAKFEFTRNISDILQNVRLLGEQFGFSPEDMSYVDIAVIESLPLEDARAILADAIRAGKERDVLTRAITLPPLILGPQDAWAFELPETEPNFVTQKRCLAPVADIALGAAPEGAIALIESADPGYDWLFARQIVGLVTAYGGCNSHMAIRAMELGIPAAIGVGETRFQALRCASVLELDAAGRTIRTLHTP